MENKTRRRKRRQRSDDCSVIWDLESPVGNIHIRNIKVSKTVLSIYYNAQTFVFGVRDMEE